MERFFFLCICMLMVSCDKKERSHHFTSVKIETVYKDSLSIRAIEVMDGSLAFAADRGVFGSVDFIGNRVLINTQYHNGVAPQFRAVAHTDTDFFMISIGSPALLYKTGNGGKMKLVYKEEGKNVFYDAMKFWNNKEGLAIGDSMNGCLSIIITRDGGHTWKKLSCSVLPEAIEGEGAFAASNTNIAIVGEQTWVATTNGRIFYSADKGASWEVYDTPIIKDAPTEGVYSIDFYDKKLGVAIGGDYTKPTLNTANKAITKDGGKTWRLLADGKAPDYKGCVQFVPHSGGQDIVAIGFTGISYSKDTGETWTELSEEPFFTIRFLNDSTAYAAGKNRIAKLVFK